MKGRGGSLAPFAQNLPQHMAPLRKGEPWEGRSLSQGKQVGALQGTAKPRAEGAGLQLVKKVPKGLFDKLRVTKSILILEALLLQKDSITRAFELRLILIRGGPCPLERPCCFLFFAFSLKFFDSLKPRAEGAGLTSL